MQCLNVLLETKMHIYENPGVHLQWNVTDGRWSVVATGGVELGKARRGGGDQSMHWGNLA